MSSEARSATGAGEAAPAFRVPSLEEYRSAAAHPARRQGGAGAPEAPFISVVTVVFNGAKTLERTLRSVRTQTFAGLEHVIVDGASRDGTLDLVARHSHPATRWISEPDRGIYDAMNKGIAMCRGEWLLFLNADDHLADDDVLAWAAENHLSDARCDILMGSTRYFSGEGDLHVAASVPSLMGRELCINHTSTFARRSLFARHGLYSLDFRIISDNEWFYRVSRDPAVAIRTTDRIVSRMNLEGFSDSRWTSGYLELHRMRRAYGMPAAKSYPLLGYQCLRTYVRKSLERWGLRPLVRIIRNRTSRINAYD